MFKNRKLIIILVIVLAFFIFAFLLKNNKLKNVSREKVQETVISIGGNKNSSSTDDILANSNKLQKTQEKLQQERIIEANLFNEAVEKGIDIDCGRIVDEYLKNLCYQKIAISFLKPELCEEINTKEEKDNCYLLSSQETAIKKKNIDYCDNIIKKERCIEVYKQAEAIDFCTEEKCLDEMQQKDTDNDGLSDYEEKIEYKTDLNNKDTDNDGLSDSAEVQIYRTDPLNRDTDNDGYSDGDEVRKGFNPNGEGKLVQ